MTISVEEWSGKDRKDENFPVGSALIAARLRPHVHAFYAFARNADDIADSTVLAPSDKVARLDVMEAALLGQSDGSPSAAALRASLAATGVTARHAQDLLIAFRRDAVQPRTPDLADLLRYCRYSAAPVGRHVLALHGESEACWPASDALCAALQLNNHLQDCGRDLADMDRCYLPDDMLARHGSDINDLRRPACTPGLRAVLDALLDECDRLTTAGAALPGLVRDRRLRAEVAVIAKLARRLSARLRRADPLAGQVKLTRGDAVRAVAGSLWRLL
jgi:farnesyl-diphosphate farnesyltransferase